MLHHGPVGQNKAIVIIVIDLIGPTVVYQGQVGRKIETLSRLQTALNFHSFDILLVGL